MKIWYCVTSTFYDDGRASAAITDTCESQNKPDDSFNSTSRRDIYRDWFGDKEEALAFVNECKQHK